MHKSLFEIAQEFETDKAFSGYTERYEHHLGGFRDAELTLLEMGVHRGGSLLMWQEYFPRAKIVGLDINPNPLASKLTERIAFEQGSQDDTQVLERVAQRHAPEGFDIVIDDAAHVGALSRAAFLHLFPNHLKPGGIYVIEDWGTGYWNTWPDGQLYQRPDAEHSAVTGRKSLIARTLVRRMLRRLGFSGGLPDNAAIDRNFACHNFGMVGFTKELVDQVAWGDISRAGDGNERLSGQDLGIEGVTLYQGQAFITKR